MTTNDLDPGNCPASHWVMTTVLAALFSRCNLCEFRRTHWHTDTLAVSPAATSGACRQRNFHGQCAICRDRQLGRAFRVTISRRAQYMPSPHAVPLAEVVNCRVYKRWLRAWAVDRSLCSQFVRLSVSHIRRDWRRHHEANDRDRWVCVSCRRRRHFSRVSSDSGVPPRSLRVPRILSR